MTQRTPQQNKSLHRLFSDISNSLIEQGIDQRTIIEGLRGYDAPVTPEFIKEVWKTIQYTMYRTTSTTELQTTQYDKVYDVLNKFLGEEFGIHCEIPSIEAKMLNREDYEL
jgi:hypothetical protein